MSARAPLLIVCLLLGACAGAPPEPPNSPQPVQEEVATHPAEAKERPPKPLSKPKPRPKPKPMPPTTSDPRACNDSSDCVIYCPEVKGCCGWRCGCKNAVNQAYKAQFKKEYSKECQRPPCPAVGCAREDALGAVCIRGSCIPRR